MKTTTEKAVVAYKILNNAKLGKMKDGDKFHLVKIMRELKPVNNGYDECIRDTAERLKPEGIEEIQNKIQTQAKMDSEELKIWNKFNSDVNRCMEEELQREVEFGFKPLSEEGFEGLIGSNDFTIGEIMALQEVIGG